ncbi:MAG: DUF507 family protein [Acidobacteria bacterium]|nr:DUF507 family protein [Acidobacteriota bacterium]MCG3193000.1 hypothetical protein [Thermoanaerobaculia bacterium]MCK6681348.1 DUF507 family protein [Thermoanaerobaculia bacterium]
MAISHDRAADLSRRIVERLAKTRGITLKAEKELVRNRIQKLLLAWDREYETLEAEAKQRLAKSGKRIPEGSREWELRFTEYLERVLEEYASRGE